MFWFFYKGVLALDIVLYFGINDKYGFQLQFGVHEFDIRMTRVRGGGGRAPPPRSHAPRPYGPYFLPSILVGMCAQAQSYITVCR